MYGDPKNPNIILGSSKHASNVNEHCAQAFYQIVDWDACWCYVLNRCSITRQDCTHEHKVEYRKLLSCSYAYQATSELSLYDALLGYPISENSMRRILKITTHKFNQFVCEYAAFIKYIPKETLISLKSTDS